MTYEIKHLTPEELAEKRAKFPDSKPLAYAVIEPTPRNPERPYLVLGYYDSGAEAMEERKKWDARDKVADIVQGMDIFDTIWNAVRRSGLDEDEVVEIIKENI